MRISQKSGRSMLKSRPQECMSATAIYRLLPAINTRIVQECPKGRDRKGGG